MRVRWFPNGEEPLVAIRVDRSLLGGEFMFGASVSLVWSSSFSSKAGVTGHDMTPILILKEEDHVAERKNNDARKALMQPLP